MHLISSLPKLLNLLLALLWPLFLSTYDTNLRELRSRLIAIGLFLFPMLLIFLQSDAGSGLVFLSFFIVLYRAGLSPNLYIVGILVTGLIILGILFDIPYVVIGLLLLCIAAFLLNFKEKLYGLIAFFALGVVTFFATQYYNLLWIIGAILLLFIALAFIQWRNRKNRLVVLLSLLLGVGSSLAYSANYLMYNVLEKHQQERIKVWLKPSECDPRGALYNVIQSKMAIGSGGFEGKGFLGGTMTKLNYVPEQSTDFIFCTIGEEQGFIGSLGIIGLFFLLLFRISVLAERQRFEFARYYAYGVGGIIFFHFFINIGMTMGLVPIIGIPLPFISYGGSSLLAFTLLIGILLKLDSERFSG